MKNTNMKSTPFFALALLMLGCNQNPTTENKSAATQSSDTSSAGTTKLNGPAYLNGLLFKNDYPTNETVNKLYDAIDFQRACQAYIWAVPIVSMNALYLGQHKDLGQILISPL